MGAQKYAYNKKKYDIKRVDRMVKDMEKHNVSYKTALKNEKNRSIRRQNAKAATIAALATIGYVDYLTMGKLHKTIIDKGKHIIKSLDDKIFKTKILDSNGKVIKRYFKSLVINEGGNNHVAISKYR